MEALRDHHKKWMSRKLGLEELEDKLQQGFMVAMAETKADFTNAFRALADVSGSQPDDDIPEALQEVGLCTTRCSLGSPFAVSPIEYHA